MEWLKKRITKYPLMAVLAVKYLGIPETLLWCIWMEKWFGVNKENKRMIKWAKIKKILETNGTFANFLLKSLLGFMSGILLTMVMFMFLLLQLNYSYTKATIISSTIGSVLTLGLAFSPICRCIFMMVLPQLFSDKGRHALLMYAFILSFSGPSKTTLHNTGVLSESLTCLQDEIKSAIRQIVEIIKKPLLAVRSSITRIKADLAVIINKMKKGMLAVKNTVTELVRTIKSAYEWLYSVMNICNKKVGTPYQRCTKMFDNALEECKVTVSPTFDWMCSISYVISNVCYTVKFLDSLCEFFELINESIFSAIQNSLKSYVRHMKNMFYVSIEFKHSFAFESTPNKLSSDIIRGIVTEIKYKIENIVMLFDWAGSIFSFFFLYVFVRVLRYRQKYLAVDSFDNKYLTNELYELDERKQILDRPTILPLTRVEKNKFIERTSAHLILKERKALFRSLAILLLATFKILIQMAVDYSLYWILITVRKYGRLSTQLDPPRMIDLNIDGDGILADLYKTIIQTFKPVANEMNMDTMSCLPNPWPPNYDCYRRIIFVLTLTWFLAIMQPYGLRFRSYVMGYYHPDVAMTRAVWLHNHIIRRRINFVKFARRFLRRKFGLRGEENTTDTSFLDLIYSKYPFLDRIWSRQKQTVCLLCGYKAKKIDLKSGEIVSCDNGNCKGVYCSKCFTDIDNKCTLCSNPINYGDITDISEEKDSSSDATETNVVKISIHKKLTKKIRKRKHALKWVKTKASSVFRRVSTDEEGNDGDESSISECSNSTCSTVSNSYENDPNYENSDLNYRTLIVESQDDIKQKFVN
ncbi:DC-STAMP domain-containing protein 2-like [Melanaphis sacchari]|uniref:DC-STAMP domain-containing protein 2-like n=1 Tax=Melanaphis sacchari TaxID=742174 RepID=UPI000DC14D4B|nr:DC-STAMP domain-containing protein 2-like [Melanaphis sacchari]